MFKTFKEAGLPVVEEFERQNLHEMTHLIRLRDRDSVNQLGEDLDMLEGLENLCLNFNKRRTKLWPSMRFNFFYLAVLVSGLSMFFSSTYYRHAQLFGSA